VQSDNIDKDCNQLILFSSPEYLTLVSLVIAQVIPQAGELFHEDVPSSILCKPKILPLKSVTLEKLEKMQKEAQDAVMEQEALEREQRQNGSF